MIQKFVLQESEQMKIKQFLPQGMEPVDSDKGFHPTDRTDREMAI